MIYRLARAYVIFFAVTGTLVLALTIFLHFWALRGNDISLHHLSVVDIVVAVPILGLAKGKNIWANEMKALPRWVRKVVLVLFVYTLAIFAATILIPGATYPSENPILISAFLCTYLSGCICIPFALLRHGYVDASSLNNRVATSMIFLAVATTFFILTRTEFLSHSHIT
jgi:hypothetical protein